MSPKTYTTRAAAERAGITRATLQAWIASRKISAPKRMVVGKVAARLWTESDVARLRQYKAANYRKGRGRKKKPKA